MIKIEKKFESGYARPVNRGIVLWNGEKISSENPERELNNLVYEALGEDDFWSRGYELKGIRVLIEIERAERQ